MYTNEEINHLVRIGFCKPSYYKQSVWKKAKVLMDLACGMNIGVEYRPVRGKGHYWITRRESNIESVIESIILALSEKKDLMSRP